ncbi:hypothetical protein FE392_19450 [Xenorhabdus sp. 12]|uniref:Metalloprotease StcE beta-sandwich domain-containing protein n=1 Tax=Xenorhabdus santafensis TaxID=2582833 RepID=A0ABU4SF63_9GAMM|nr:hypothetical protein [Xenorhabdus sp. 12]MDX7989434.1 hypothetical protein [Xenorhabdus sp. 12]
MMKIIGNKSPLERPILPQKDKNGVLDVSLMQNDFMLVVIEHFDNERLKSEIKVLLNDVEMEFYFLEENIPFTVHITIPFSNISDGDYIVTYTVTDAANVRYSKPSHVKIANTGRAPIPSLYLTMGTKENDSGATSKQSVIAHYCNAPTIDQIQIKFYMAARMPVNSKLYTYMTTSDGDWSPIIILPTTAKDGAYVIITTHAEYNGLVSKSSKPSADLTIIRYNTYMFQYSTDTRQWSDYSGNNDFPTSGDDVIYMTPNDIIPAAYFVGTGGLPQDVKPTGPNGQAITEITSDKVEHLTVFATLLEELTIHDSIEFNFIP